jgi:hypothetical protein
MIGFENIILLCRQFFTQPERVFEKDMNKSGTQRSQVTTQTREKENYYIYI